MTHHSLPCSMWLVCKCREHVGHITEVHHLVVPAVLLEVAGIDGFHAMGDCVDCDLVWTNSYDWTMLEVSVMDGLVLLASVPLVQDPERRE